LMQLSSVAAAQGDERQALEHVSHAAILFERAEGPAHPDTAAARGLEGAYLVSLGRCGEAGRLLEAALEARGAANPHHPYLGLNHWDLGNLYRKLGDEGRAQSHFEQARALLRESFGEGHRYVGSLLADIGRLRVAQGRPAEALPLQDEALAILSRSPTRDYGGALAPQAVRGLAFGAQGQWARSRDAYAEALATGQRLLGARDPRLAEPLTGQAEASLALGRPQDALPLLRAAQELRKDRPGDPAETARTRFALAQALWESGSQADARGAAEEARALAAKACNPQLAGVTRVEAWLADHGH
jgi:tetratricopeptide (TPR) repeat protein